MLLNLTQDLCVSRHSSASIDRWICYSPSTSAGNKKRITWQNRSGLLTTEGMQTWLHAQFPNDAPLRRFSELANQ